MRRSESLGELVRRLDSPLLDIEASMQPVLIVAHQVSASSSVVPAWYERGTSVVRAWYERGTSVVRAWYERSTSVVQAWYKRVV